MRDRVRKRLATAAPPQLAQHREALSLWSPRSPTASPHQCSPWPSLLFLHSDQISPQGSSVRGCGAPPARELCGPRPWGGGRQEDCIRPVRRLPASDFPCRESQQRAQHRCADAQRDRDREPNRWINCCRSHSGQAINHPTQLTMLIGDL